MKNQNDGSRIEATLETIADVTLPNMINKIAQCQRKIRQRRGKLKSAFAVDNKWPSNSKQKLEQTQDEIRELVKELYIELRENEEAMTDFKGLVEMNFHKELFNPQLELDFKNEYYEKITVQ